jgi:histidinol-phosphatase (PHP family)
MPRDDFDDWRMRLAELDLYVEKVELARRKFPNLNIKLALEVDYLPGYEDWIRDLSQRYPWDYLIGSVHYISPSWAIDNPLQLSEWRKHDAFEVWTAYFDRLNMAAESGLFDIIGHADLCKKFCIYPKQDCTEFIARFLQAAGRNDVAIELNTAGLRKDCKEIYPSRSIVEMARRSGVAITFGSDAHAPAEVGLNFVEAVELARRSGYTHWIRFTQRQRTLVEL